MWTLLVTRHPQLFLCRAYPGSHCERMVDALINGAPPQSIGCCSASGWTDSTLFLKWLEHFTQLTNRSPQAPQLIIMDGHHSHKTLSEILYAREHGITLITLLPHSTHKMQPLDRMYFKSLKCAYKTQCDSWMVTNPEKRITFFHMAAIFGRAYLKTVTCDKAVNGFSSWWKYFYWWRFCSLESHRWTSSPNLNHNEQESTTEQQLPVTDFQSSTASTDTFDNNSPDGPTSSKNQKIDPGQLSNYRR